MSQPHGRRHLATISGDYLDARSAGSRPAGYVYPMAIEVMKEIGIDISWQDSKSLDHLLHQPAHTIITVCGKVDQICPTFPQQVERIHHAFDDPAHADLWKLVCRTAVSAVWENGRPAGVPPVVNYLYGFHGLPGFSLVRVLRKATRAALSEESSGMPGARCLARLGSSVGPRWMPVL